MKLYLLSDTHFEFYSLDEARDNYRFALPEEHDYDSILTLAGDIAYPNTTIYKDFIQYCCDRFKHVLVIPGNHEYYNIDMSILEIDNMIEIICNEVGATYLQKKSIIINNHTFIGATCWTNIEKNEMHYIKSNIRDYRHIKDLVINPSYSNKLHRDHFNYLLEEINKSNNPVIVITHHSISRKMSIPEYAKHRATSAFCSNYDHLIPDKVKYWISGHTHYSTRIQLPNGPILLSNVFGYKNEYETRFDNDFELDL